MARRIYIVHRVEDALPYPKPPIKPTEPDPELWAAYDIARLAYQAEYTKIAIEREGYILSCRLEAEANSCGELVTGIPPALVRLITDDMLPFVYEEPSSLPGPEPRDLGLELDDVKTGVDEANIRIDEVNAKIHDYEQLKVRVKVLEDKEITIAK